MAYLGVSFQSKAVPDGIEPSFPGCEPSVVAVGPRDCVAKVDPPGIAPGSPACDTGIFLLDDEPILVSGSRGTRTHKRFHTPAVFKTVSSSGRMTSVYKLRELESNQRPPGSEPGVTTNSNCSASFVLSTTLANHSGSQSSGGRNRTYGLLVQSQASLPTATTPQSNQQRDGRDSNPRVGT